MRAFRGLLGNWNGWERERLCQDQLSERLFVGYTFPHLAWIFSFAAKNSSRNTEKDVPSRSDTGASMSLYIGKRSFLSDQWRSTTCVSIEMCRKKDCNVWISLTLEFHFSIMMYFSEMIFIKAKDMASGTFLGWTEWKNWSRDIQLCCLSDLTLLLSVFFWIYLSTSRVQISFRWDPRGSRIRLFPLGLFTPKLQ
jgi:hypothetical protein